MASATSEPTEEVPRIEILDTPKIRVVPFAVPLPPSTLQEFDEPTPKQRMESIMGDHAIVGSVVILNNSVMVWVGWGTIDYHGSSRSSMVCTNSSFGKGAPVMGQVLVSMPRTNYKGAFGTGSKEPSSSQIIGSSSSEDRMLASQMASRLTTRSGMAVFVSCQLSSTADSGGGGTWTDGMDSDIMSHRAAALAEKEVWNILQEQH